MADEPTSTARTDPATDEVTVDELPLDMPANRPAQSSLSADDLGNAPNTLDVEAVNCVFIQWCDEPGGNGTVCVIRSGCHPNGCIVTPAITQECVDDFHAVCSKNGNPVQPAIYRCQ
ncbi:MAG TPA: hypothetical protein VGD80_29350 [Kofleriaceae bacterium]